MDGKEKDALAARLGARIAAFRTSAGMTQAELAVRLGIGDEHVSRFERGTVLPTLPRLFDIAEAFQRGVDELLVDASPRRDDQSTAIARRIGELGPADRAFVASTVDQLADHLSSRVATTAAASSRPARR